MIVKELEEVWSIACLLGLFDDSKTLVDATIRTSLHALLHDFTEFKDRYENISELSSQQNHGQALLAASSVARFSALGYEMKVDLRRLLDKHLDFLDCISTHQIKEYKNIDEYIESMWSLLLRQPHHDNLSSTLIPTNSAYLVPGGRFNEFYYWDSYFISIGLLASRKFDLLLSVTNNIAQLIDSYGFVPNGGRSYYLTRSQPPFFACMITLLQAHIELQDIKPYIEKLEVEYAFWTTQRRSTAKVPLEQGLSNYSDSALSPRPEAFLQDISTCFSKYPERNDCWRDLGIYRDIRAAAESGWDFSSRWLARAGGKWNLETIRTTQIIPFDLNCLLFIAECTLAKHHNDGAMRAKYDLRAAQRRLLLTAEPFWDSSLGWFYDCVSSPDNTLKSTGNDSLVASYALFANLATNEQALAVAEKIKNEFLMPGGVVTTTSSFHSGQQWDYPNGWAPLQWITVIGLINYGHADLAIEICTRFIDRVEKVFLATGYIMEKYDVSSNDSSNAGEGGGEYANQYGFGWTNGVFAGLRKIAAGDTAWLMSFS